MALTEKKLTKLLCESGLLCKQDDKLYVATKETVDVTSYIPELLSEILQASPFLSEIVLPPNKD